MNNCKNQPQAFDHYGVNDMVVALAKEMSSQKPCRHYETDTLFLGGVAPTEVAQRELGNFALSKNYNLIYASFDVANPAAGPIDFHAVITDGCRQSVTIRGGRIWKRDRRTPTVLLFIEDRTVMKMSVKRRIIFRAMKGDYHEQGYESALDALKDGIGSQLGATPIVSTIGSLPIVMDMRTFKDTFAAAA